MTSRKKSGRTTPLEERDALVQLECDQCGKDFYKWKKDVSDGERGNFCSNNCYYRWQSESEGMTEHMRKIGKKGKEGWTQETYKKHSKRMSGSSNPAWKGGVTYEKRRGNYKRPVLVRCPEEYEEMARKNGYVLEHRLKVAQQIGRPLKSEEVVHHVDHNPENNEIENLILFRNNKEHKLYEHNGKPAPIWQPSNQ